jgi:hypothetical protein
VGSSEIATSAVGSSEIATSAVGSSEIADGAVTQIMKVETSGEQYTTSTGWEDIPSLHIDVITAASTVQASFHAPDTWNDWSNVFTFYRILIDGEQKTFGVIGGPNYPSQMRMPISLSWTGVIGPGNHTLKVQWKVVNAGVGWIGSYGPANLTVVEYKK